jgi:hypothetical protein
MRIVQDVLGPKRAAILKRLRRSLDNPSHGDELLGDRLRGLPTLANWAHAIP